MSHEASGKGRQREGCTLRFGFGARSCHMQRSTAVQRVGRHVLNRFWCTRWAFGQCVTLRTACVRVVACNVSCHSHVRLQSPSVLRPARSHVTCAARTTSGELSGASALGTAWVQLHIVSHLVRVQDEVHLKPREPILGASSIKGCSALARSGVAELWFIFMHVCVSVFQLCTLLNTCNAARSATASRIFVLPSEINSLSAEFLHAI